MSTQRLKLDEHIMHRDLPLHISLVQVDREVMSHDHDFIEIAMVLRGRCRHQTLYDTQSLRRGDMIVLRPGVWHAYSDCHNLLIGNCGIGLALRQRELAWTRNDPQLDYLLWSGPWSAEHQGLIHGKLTAKTLQNVQQEMGVLERLLHTQQSVSRAVVLAHLLLLLGEIGHSWNSTNVGLTQSNPPIHPAIHDAIVLMEEQITYPWTLPELAQKVQLNRAYLVRLFSGHCGLPPMAYLNRLRLERAASLLRRTTKPVGRIAAAVGILDANYFARRFRQHFGITPSQMQQRQRI